MTGAIDILRKSEVVQGGWFTSQGAGWSWETITWMDRIRRAFDHRIEMAGRFQAELMTALSGWKERLGANPDHLVELEQQIHAAFSRGADLLIVGLMAVVTNVARSSQKLESVTKRDAAVPLGRGRSCRGKCGSDCSAV